MNKQSRKLPRTTTIIHHENAALKNKVECLEASLHAAYADIQQLMKERDELKKENLKLKCESWKNNNTT